MTPTKKALLQAYNNATDEGKQLLKGLYGEDFFKSCLPPTFEFALEEFMKMEHTDPTNKILLERVENEQPLTAADKLMIIAHVLMGGWVPDYTNGKQYKWFPYFKFNSASGFGFSCAYCDSTFAFTDGGARFALPTSELAEYFGTQFIDLWNEFLIVK